MILKPFRGKDAVINELETLHAQAPGAAKTQINKRVDRVSRRGFAGVIVPGGGTRQDGGWAGAAGACSPTLSGYADDKAVGESELPG